jgi:hypothetical protein
MPRLNPYHGTSAAISVGGNLEPIEPVYTKANHQSALGTPYPIPGRPAMNYLDAPVVKRREDTRGMRYLWADIRQRMPISPLGTGPDIGNAVWSSEFQPVQGSLRDYGFYDLLFRAGYPGFNLGISFRVPVNPSVGTNSPGMNIKMHAPPQKFVVNVLKRATSRPNHTG